MNVAQLMTAAVVTVPPEMTLKEVAALLVRHRISGVPVCDAGGRVVGVVSEADIIWKELGLPPEHRRTYGLVLDLAYGDSQRNAARTAEEAMTSPAVTVSAKAPVSAAAKLMVTHAVNRLPVVDDDRLVGIVTRADLVRAFTRSDSEIEQEIRDDVLLETLWIDPGTVSISVVNGEIALAGEVENRTTAQLVEAYVRRVPGVVSVRSGLRWRFDDRRQRVATTSYSDGSTIY
jgi:CBS domain-containing protein